MTPEEGYDIVRRHLSGELSQDEAASLLLTNPEGGFNLSLVGMPEADRNRVSDLFQAALLLAGRRAGGAA
jgi:hypothetical protein